MNVINLTESEFIQQVADFRAPHSAWRYFGNQPAIVDFYAGWCGPCRVLAPILEELADVYKDQIVVYKVDVDKCEDLAKAFNISSIPALLFIPMEGEPEMLIGLRSKEALESDIKSKLLNK